MLVGLTLDPSGVKSSPGVRAGTLDVCTLASRPGGQGLVQTWALWVGEGRAQGGAGVEPSWVCLCRCGRQRGLKRTEALFRAVGGVAGPRSFRHPAFSIHSRLSPLFPGAGEEPALPPALHGMLCSPPCTAWKGLWRERRRLHRSACTVQARGGTLSGGAAEGARVLLLTALIGH